MYHPSWNSIARSEPLNLVLAIALTVNAIVSGGLLAAALLCDSFEYGEELRSYFNKIIGTNEQAQLHYLNPSRPL